MTHLNNIDWVNEVQEEEATTTKMEEEATITVLEGTEVERLGVPDGSST